MSGQLAALDESETVAPESVIEFLEFRLDGARYALEIGRIGPVVRRPATTRVPGAPSGVYGASTNEGEVVVVVDTYAVVGLDRPFVDPDEGYLVLLKQDDTPQPIGLLAEEIDGITRRHVDTVSPPRTGGTSVDDRWFRATIEGDGGRDVPVFDSQQLVAALHAARGSDMNTMQQTDAEDVRADRDRTEDRSGVNE
jgi:purine-binding chemotaxis protein CheW